MIKREFVGMMKDDEELQELRRKVYSITGQLEDISFRIGANYTYEEWKEKLRKIVKEHDTTSQKWPVVFLYAKLRI
jgi:hypothetical protein|nr:MAG TPA: hypothetical protein [Caudoviricetes sp.]